MNINDCFSNICGNTALKARLAREISSGRGLSHAYIIEGRTGSGRHTLAVNIAAALSCENKNADCGLPCGACNSCRKILSGISPDVIMIARENGKASIGIDTIRSLRNDVHVLPNELENKIYIIDDADLMTAQAQNALLLTLEEPPSYAVFLLIAENSKNLLETIRSRAPALRMQPLPTQMLADVVVQRSPDAAELNRTDKDKFSGLIMTADGSLGQALSLFSAKTRDAVLSKRSTVLRFCRTAHMRGNGRELLSLFAPYSSGKRDEALDLFENLLLALMDLAAQKKNEYAQLRFFSNRDEAEELCSTYTLTRILQLYEAAETARESLLRNANTRLVMTEFVDSVGARVKKQYR